MKTHALTKKQLATLYFPDDSPRAAAEKLRRLINTTPGLLPQLQQTHYLKTQKTLTPRQTKLILQTLGDP